MHNYNGFRNLSARWFFYFVLSIAALSAHRNDRTLGVSLLPSVDAAPFLPSNYGNANQILVTMLTPGSLDLMDSKVSREALPVAIHILRGGAQYSDDDNTFSDDDDDEYDGNSDPYDQEEESDEEEGLATRRDSYDHGMIDPPKEARARERPPGGPGPHKGQQGKPLPPSSGRRKRRAHWTQRLATTTFKMGSDLALGAVQQTGKMAYQLVKPRHVDPRELTGLWRMDQQVAKQGRGGGDLASVATVELDSRKRLVTLTLPDGKTIVKPYVFKKTRLGSYKTEFILPAFLVGSEPRLYGYKGIWQRKLADKKVIKLVGKIYQVRKQRFGKQKGSYQFIQPVGTFVARRRMKLSDEEEDDDEYDDGDFDGDEEEFDEDDDGERTEDGVEGYDETTEDNDGFDSYDER